MNSDSLPTTAFIRCGTKQYSFAIKVAVNGKPYLAIIAENTPRLLAHQDTTPERTTMSIFPEHTSKFGAVVNAMLGSLEAIAQKQVTRPPLKSIKGASPAVGIRGDGEHKKGL